MTELRIPSGGVVLAATQSGDPAAPTVVLLHGYPDTGAVWAAVTGHLVAAGLHVVAYDTRGMGASTAPDSPAGYRIGHLLDDLATVLDHVSPDRPVHLVGHDWGALQGWAAVFHPGLRARIATYTSLNGVSMDHVDGLIGSTGPLTALRQRLTSSYIAAMQVPRLPELALGALAPLAARGLPHEAAPTLADDLRHGVQLYRQNLLGSDRAPAPATTPVPVQLVVATRDPYLLPPVALAHRRLAPVTWVRRLPAGHWPHVTRPGLVARWIAEFAAARPDRAREFPVFQDQLVVVTGAGSGIGRATARAFAVHGARVVAADIDEAAAQQTATATGGHAYQVDVADPAAMANFAAWVRDEHGVPDVVVNNAGIGVAGPVLDTDEEDWARIRAVNLDGVYRGCRLFGAQLVARGEGGHLVNLASMAAYTPTPELGAYAATKAAVLQLSEVLRIELRPHGIGVSAICPGVINTPITQHVRYLSGDPERRKAMAAEAFARRAYPPEKVATAILTAVLRDRAVVPVAPEAWTGYLLSRLSPGAMRALGGLSRRVSDRVGRR